MGEPARLVNLAATMTLRGPLHWLRAEWFAGDSNASGAAGRHSLRPLAAGHAAGRVLAPPTERFAMTLAGSAPQGAAINM